MKRIGLFCTIFVTLLVVPIRAAEPTEVALVQLIANPEKFDGKLVRVIGFLRLEFEGNALYFHREDYENALMRNGIWVDVTPEMMRQRKALNLHYVLLEGIFTSNDRRNTDGWGGSISEIRRAQLWPFGKQPPRKK